ncbi:MAG: metallophosphoesterase [Hespellia sp.]|nr:metallophosphoesterase [Hespellia sp.]
MIYIMSDIHGDCTRFLHMLGKIEFSRLDTLYILGDVIDRGTENLKMLDYCMGRKNIILLKGNHEYFLQHMFEDESFRQQWWDWDGENTIRELDKLSRTRKQVYYEYVKSLPLYVELEMDREKFFLTHSGYDADMEHVVKDGEIVCLDTMQKLEDEQHYLLSYDLHTMPASLKFDQRFVVGHLPTMFIESGRPGKIYRHTTYIDVDCGNSSRETGGMLGCLSLDTMQEWYL